MIFMLNKLRPASDYAANAPRHAKGAPFLLATLVAWPFQTTQGALPRPLREGFMTGELPREKFSQEALLHLMV
jgi:hypothetical protein